MSRPDREEIQAEFQSEVAGLIDEVRDSLLIFSAKNAVELRETMLRTRDRYSAGEFEAVNKLVSDCLGRLQPESEGKETH